MSGNKDRLVEFCRNAYVPLQLQPWWLDAVCGEQHWQVALSVGRNGRPTGILPYFLTRQWGLRVVRMPPFTAYAGPWLREPDHPDWPEHRRLAFEQQAHTALIGQIPQTFFWVQHFRPEIRNWLPFHRAGFRQTTRYTYMLPATLPWAGFCAGIKDTMRTELNKAARHSVVVEGQDAQLVFRLNRLSYARKGLPHPHRWAPLERLHRALSSRGQALVLEARRRRNGAPMAALYLAFDQRQAAVLLSGLDPEFRNSGALHGLYEAAARYCIERQLTLDFEGSMDPGIERVFRAFGAQLTPYLRVWRAGYRWLDALYRS